MEHIGSIACGGLFLLFAFFSGRQYIHMLQLNSYRAERYGRWLAEDVRRVLNLRAVFVWMAALLYPVSPTAALIAAAALFALLNIRKKPAAKKPLVYTARVKRLLVTFMIVNMLFLASLVHPLWFLALLPLAGLLEGELVLISLWINEPMERAVAHHYYKEAKDILQSMKHLIVIGVTGSFGKTSTKYAVAQLLSEKYNVLMTPGSFNTPMGVVRTIRESLKPTHQVFVVEMGAKNKGDIKELCDLVSPTLGIISSVGPQHLETFGSMEAIVATKFELADAVQKNGGVMFLNYDNEYIRKRAFEGPKVTYGTGDGCDVAAKDISYSASGAAFSINGHAMKTKLLGQFNVVNIAGAAALAKHLGVAENDIAAAVRRLEAPEHRLKLSKNGRYTLIDDAYNANPSGARAALEVLSLFPERKILVTPGLVELGDQMEEANRALGAQAAKAADDIVRVGEKQAPPLREGALSAGFPEERLYVAKDIYDALHYVDTITGDPAVVLLENDLPDNFL